MTPEQPRVPPETLFEKGIRKLKEAPLTAVIDGVKFGVRAAIGLAFLTVGISFMKDE